MTVPLSAVAAELQDSERRGPDVDLVEVTHDSMRAAPGSLFCAVRGARTDGHDHADGAVANGASALLVERWLPLDVPQVRVPSVRAAAGPAAASVHRHPSRELRVVGVTGTNGKTTTCYLLEGAFAASGLGTGVIGTIETRIHGATEPGSRTTPEGPDLQRLLRSMHDRGVDAVAMEVSSHGLDLRRVDGTRFGVAVYTNLSQDHLDWHGSMEAYWEAKARLFTPELSERGVVHLDGPWARRLVERAEVPVTTLGRGDDADVRLVDVVTTTTGGRARLLLDDRELEVRTQLPGAFNVVNAALAVLAARSSGIPDDAAVAGVAACAGVRGRFDRVDAGQPFSVFVDYAHTPDAVMEVTRTVREMLDRGGRFILVLGCGGERDRGKRGPMGAAAAQADVAVLTSDNPRGEDPHAILDEMLVGAQQVTATGRGGRIEVEPDRRTAIASALATAVAGDVVVIAGKGHETSQEVAGHALPFDDRIVADELLRRAPATSPEAP